MVRVRNSVRTSASDDHTRVAVEMARKRLDLEKAERLRAMQARIERGREGEAEDGGGNEKMDV